MSDPVAPRRTRTRVVIIAVWLVLIGWLVRYEAFPEYFSRTLAGYRGLLSGDVLVQDNWMKVLFKDHPIGYSHTCIEVDEEDPLNHYRVFNRLYVRLKAMGFEQPVFVDTEARVDAMHALRRFQFMLSSRNYKLNISAKRVENNRFRGIMKTGNTKQVIDIEVPEDVILYSPMTEMAVKHLKPGQELSVQTLDPATLKPATVTIRATARERLETSDSIRETTVLETEYLGIKMKSWMSDEGELLRQETPLGWTLIACTADEALETIDMAADARDIVADLAVRCEGTIDHPRSAKGLRVRLSGAKFSAATLASDRQKVVEQTDAGLTLLVSAGRKPRGGVEGSMTTDALAPYLEATPFVQAAHPELRKAVEGIVEGLEGQSAMALAIFDWVYENVRKELTVSLPSALDVLHRLAGDCNEHTYLFTGLARAAGIPTKIMVGVAYHEGAFYYHAWPAVYLGEWIEMDPTWGQQAVDATHIRLIEGELSDQMALIQLVGRIRIEIVEQL